MPCLLYTHLVAMLHACKRSDQLKRGKTRANSTFMKLTVLSFIVLYQLQSWINRKKADTKLVGQLVSQLLSQLVSQLVSQVVSQLVGKLVRQLVSYLVSMFVSQLVGQLHNQLVSQLVIQLVSQLFYQLNKLAHSFVGLLVHQLGPPGLGYLLKNNRQLNYGVKWRLDVGQKGVMRLGARAGLQRLVLFHKHNNIINLNL